MPLQLVTGPAVEPLSRTQAKAHVRLTTTDEDAWIDGAVIAARQACETRTQNQLLAARWKLLLDSFPGSLEGAVSYVPWGRTYGLPANAILLPRAPVIQLASLTYLDMAGATQTLVAGQSGDYISDLDTAQAVPQANLVRITPPFGKVWPPNVLPQVGAVAVTFDAGYAARLTADAAADWIYVPGWKTLAVNDRVRFSNRDGALPAPLVAATDYYVKAVVSTDKYQLSATAGGALIDLADTGTGESFIGEIPASLQSWMKLAIGTVFENRESISVDTRITQIEMPTDFQDGLLDPFRLALY